MERERRTGRSPGILPVFDRMETDFRYVEEQARKSLWSPVTTPPGGSTVHPTPVACDRMRKHKEESINGKHIP